MFVGLTTLDIAYLVDAYPAEDTKTQALDQFLGAGGPAANAAVTYAYLSRSSPTLLTAVGRHPLAEIVGSDLVEHGVGVLDAIPDSALQPPLSSIVVARQTHTRTVVSLDAQRIEAPFDEAFGAAVGHAGIVLMDGHFRDLAMGIATRARDAGIPVVLDAGRWKDSHRDLLPLVDIAICSAVFRPPLTEYNDSSKLFDAVHAMGPTHVAITRGAEPIRYSGPDGRGEVDVEPVHAVDTLGAGDILHGAFCHYFTASGDFAGALGSAAAVASVSCRWLGTREWMRHSESLRV
ncbi:PfkB family carbohydrate kinase [Antrihabitans sp. YC2-6]|uniref:PfkB family carbohydrate kinase n=1 Tax=Antrihabitans sp. YC2-6 TaxID=2799498 RepID=UPI0018F54A78|nr:PfkB family carbohydrate kinase [Antrihabitans sp. YC2-6]MBJ8343787.1 sugar kinase [Antrihabitans sp. YC2-6]